jgi:hypothetical protein
MGWILGTVLLVALFVALQKRGGEKPESGPAAERPRYPYRPDVEVRLPGGRLTTRGYAAAHPGEFVHWQFGPENVYGERIDRDDWENWRVNYYGM